MVVLVEVMMSQKAQRLQVVWELPQQPACRGFDTGLVLPIVVDLDHQTSKSAGAQGRAAMLSSRHSNDLVLGVVQTAGVFDDLAVTSSRAGRARRS